MGYSRRGHELGGHDRQELGALINYGAMHTTLHWTNEDVVHAIDLDSLVDQKDHCQMRNGVFVCNPSIYGMGIGMLGLFVKAADVDETFMVVND